MKNTDRARLEKFLIQAWARRGFFMFLFWPVAVFFGALLWLRRVLFRIGFYRSTQLPLPLIVVGNIYIGGTGKTPMVIYLLQQLKQAGWNPGVISRAYGVKLEQPREVLPDSLASEVGDEPLLIQQRSQCPMMVGADRVACAHQLIEKHPQLDILISDDGLQHLAFKREVEIVMFDQRGVGNGQLLPAGPLREKLSADYPFAVLNSVPEDVRANLPRVLREQAWPMRLQATQCWQLQSPAQHQALAEFKGKRILAAAGIGHPQRFFSMLASHDFEMKTLALPDHYAFEASTFAHLDAEIILITEKDAVKCRQIAQLQCDARIWVVPVEAQLPPEFMAKLLAALPRKKNGYTIT